MVFKVCYHYELLWAQNISYKLYSLHENYKTCKLAQVFQYSKARIHTNKMHKKCKNRWAFVKCTNSTKLTNHDSIKNAHIYYTQIAAC